MSFKLSTFHNSTPVLAVSCRMNYFNVLGRTFRSVFLSSPMRLVQSHVPDPLPSAFRFSQTENDTPQLLMTSISLSRWTLSLSFHCMTSSTKLPIETSVMWSIKCSSSKMMWSSGMLRRGSCTQQQFSPLDLEAKVAQQLVEESCYYFQLPIKETVLILCRSTM